MNALSKKQIEQMNPATLKDLAERGIIQVVTTQPIPTSIEETPEFHKQIKLKGKPIHLSEACRKYNVSLSTISQWKRRGILPVIGKEKNRVLFDEAYVAYFASVLHSHKTRKGKWLFDDKGLPYSPTTLRTRSS